MGTEGWQVALCSKWSRFIDSWIKVEGKWYYLDPYCVMVTGWITIDGKWYNFHGDGRMATQEWRKKGEDWYYCRSNGEILKDDFRKYTDGKWYY